MGDADATGPIDVRARAQARHVVKTLEGPAAVRVLTPGCMLGRFELRRVLGRGGTATVFAAHDTDAQRDVALKVLRDSDAWHSGAASRRAFLAESRALSKLRHEGIVRVYDAGMIEGHAVLTMEWVEGMTFDAWLDAAPRDMPSVCACVAEVCDALAAAHAIDIVHRDVKPSNVVVRPQGRITLLDFGLARAVEGRVATASSVVLGTLGFIAPERLRGATGDAAADQYGAGALLCVGLGVSLHPDTGPSGAALTRLPAALAAVLRRAVHPDPRQRFESTAALATALRRFVQPARPTRWIWALAGAALLAVVVGLVLALRG